MSRLEVFTSARNTIIAVVGGCMYRVLHPYADLPLHSEETDIMTRKAAQFEFGRKFEKKNHLARPAMKQNYLLAPTAACIIRH